MAVDALPRANMAFKFLQIVGANKRIDELEAQVATITKERDEAVAALDTNTKDISAAGEQAQKDLAVSAKLVEDLTASLHKANAALDANALEIKSLGDKLASKDTEVAAKVAQKAMETQAALGQPAAPTPPKEAQTSKPGASGISRVIAAATVDLEKAGYVRKN